VSYFVLRDAEFDSVDAICERLAEASERAVENLHRFRGGPYRIYCDETLVVTLSWKEDEHDADDGRVVLEWAQQPRSAKPVTTRFRFRR
jgi:hypothetical protein